ncbi:hypothetical protein Alide2_1494 [Alicycliphilus denitrificans K601]|uniref:Uncharacterized protein n=1 Tax=Alicycliphilus denitrificans (strain DSM 14773 / CIP 107495 / K601) TaxID=596154 RepID=F4GFG0_ALIDK|nr:hypothetical protein Alide_2953 [Alicycliphilus denitrificans BC]AEB83892.1 hypothetical protein Alide2_1494 [Alicycliphilus denitrificans K601]
MSADFVEAIYRLIGTPSIFKEFSPRNDRAYCGSRSHF